MIVTKVTDKEEMCNVELEFGSEEEFKTLVAYGKQHTTDKEYAELALTKILTDFADESRAEEYKETRNTILTFCENAAELGVPMDEEVDMWFRELSDKDQFLVAEKLERIMERNITAKPDDSCLCPKCGCYTIAGYGHNKDGSVTWYCTECDYVDEF